MNARKLVFREDGYHAFKSEDLNGFYAGYQFIADFKSGEIVKWRTKNAFQPLRFL